MATAESLAIADCQLPIYIALRIGDDNVNVAGHAGSNSLVVTVTQT